MNNQIEALARACQHLADTRKAYLEFVRLHGAGDSDAVATSLQAAAAKIAEIRRRIEDERRRRNDEIYGAGVLRVAVRCNGREVKVTVTRPDNRSELPYIGEAAYNALRFRLGASPLSVAASFALNVVAASGRVVATIPQGK